MICINREVSRPYWRTGISRISSLRSWVICSGLKSHAPEANISLKGENRNLSAIPANVISIDPRGLSS